MAVIRLSLSMTMECIVFFCFTPTAAIPTAAIPISIMDNDTVEVVFNPTQYTVNEGDGVVTLTLNANKPASFEYTVEVETQDGTATGNVVICYIYFYKFPGLCYVQWPSIVP